jgi:hypothetical protein
MAINWAQLGVKGSYKGVNPTLIVISTQFSALVPSLAHSPTLCLDHSKIWVVHQDRKAENFLAPLISKVIFQRGLGLYILL